MAMSHAYRYGRADFHLERSGCFEELDRREIAEVFHGAVVRQDLHLVVRKGDRQHRLASSLPGSSVRARAALAALWCRRDIQRGNVGERRHQTIAIRAVYPPHRMLYGVGRHEIVQRLRCCRAAVIPSTSAFAR